MGLDCTDQWSDAELAAGFEYHLNSPLIYGPMPGDQIGNPAKPTCSAIPVDLCGLLAEANPPVEILRQVKEIAKGWASMRESDPFLPKEVAAAIYYLTIATALLKSNERITDLEDADLKRGLEWVAGRSWLEAKWRRLAIEAERCLSAG